MYRHSFSFSVRSGQLGFFLTDLGKSWDGMRNIIHNEKVSNFSIWNVGLVFFCYYESNYQSPVTVRIMGALSPEIVSAYNWISDPNQDMALMYDDYGIVRKDKSMIRHRVFVTRLLTGNVAEYKRRHDAKKAQMSMTDFGPDSNFTIWNAGDYIFGYDEIDTSMEHEMTQLEKQETVNWERHMLEIMEWLTNDVDWITNEQHPSIKRICFEA